MFVTKVNDMISDFAYLCDVLPNGTVHFINHTMSMLNINSVQTSAFDLGTKENPQEILIASNVTPEERVRFEQIIRRWKEVFAWTYSDMPGIDRGIA